MSIRDFVKFDTYRQVKDQLKSLGAELMKKCGG
jgi:hypothetical protein